ncbi:MAG: zinc dependent phospholipase C family protein [Spirochaetaceae bacterium]|nr:zinc dependent phospholipase C family protein [Spirochaetaceae bacterium]
MSSFITHVIAGEEALSRALPDSAFVLQSAGDPRPFFRLGCQGPDIFYHNQRTKPSGLHYGALAHRHGYGALIAGAFAALPAADRRPDRPGGAYLLGLATHAAVDRATHPFIVCFSGWADPSRPETEIYRGCHPFLERLLDLAYLKVARGQSGAEYDVEALLDQDASRSPPEDGDLIPLWAGGLRRAYPRSAGGDFLIEKRIANALADARYFYGITNPAVTALNSAREDWFAYLDDRAGARTVALVYPDDLPLDLDLMNESRAEWPHPAGDGRVSRSTYVELVTAGIGKATENLRVLLDAMAAGKSGKGSMEQVEASIEIAVGNGSLSVCDPDGSPAAPRACRPLPLRLVMEAEYRKRLEWAKHLLVRARRD